MALIWLFITIFICQKQYIIIPALQKKQITLVVFWRKKIPMLNALILSAVKKRTVDLCNLCTRCILIITYEIPLIFQLEIQKKKKKKEVFEQVAWKDQV